MEPLQIGGFSRCFGPKIVVSKPKVAEDFLAVTPYRVKDYSKQKDSRWVICVSRIVAATKYLRV